MRRKHKALAMLALLLFLGLAAGACSGTVAREPQTQSEAGDEADHEEVLSGDEDEFGRTDFSRADNQAGGFLVSVGYLAMIIGSAILPLLFL